MRSLCRQDKKELKVLAEDFGLLEWGNIQEMIEECTNYEEGQRAIMRAYDQAYMQQG